MTERSDTSPNGGPTSVVAAAEAVLSLENAALPLAITRPDGRAAMANRAMRDLLGYGETIEALEELAEQRGNR
jgi:PAS domain-containing protein